MNERNAELLSQVRLYLKEPTPIIQDTDIYTKANRMQGIILRELKPEKEFLLYGENYLDGFDFADEKTFLIKTIRTSWSDSLEYVNPQLWRDFENATSSNPIYLTIFGNKLLLAPKPVIGQNITIWGHQMGVITKMENDIPPEIPEYADNALIYGIMSCFNIDWQPKFEVELERILLLPHIKTTELRITESNW